MERDPSWLDWSEFFTVHDETDLFDIHGATSSYLGVDSPLYGVPNLRVRSGIVLKTQFQSGIARRCIHIRIGYLPVRVSNLLDSPDLVRFRGSSFHFDVLFALLQ